MVVAFLLSACEPNADRAGRESEAAISTSDGAIKRHEIRGVVQTITPSKSYVNIAHEAIPDYMDAMSMFFEVRDSTVLEGIAVSDSVMFTLELEGNYATVVAIEVIE
jgi:Cu/Ag efflux protein CusF